MAFWKPMQGLDPISQIHLSMPVLSTSIDSAPTRLKLVELLSNQTIQVPHVKKFGGRFFSSPSLQLPIWGILTGPCPCGLGQGSQAVGGAACIGDHGVAALVVLVVHTHDVHGHRVLKIRTFRCTG